MDKIGLNGAWALTKGARITYRIKRLVWEIRYALQRAWRGYDDTDIFELWFNIVHRMPVLLREFKENNIALFPDLDGGRLSLTEEETDAIIDEMIFYFENCDEDVVFKRLFGDDGWKDAVEKNKVEQFRAELNRCQTEALRLLSKWCWCLWY